MPTVSLRLRLGIGAGVAAVLGTALLVSCAPVKQGSIAGQLPSAQLRQAEFLAGLTAVTGPGIRVTLADSKKSLPSGMMPPGLTPPNLIHDTDINQVVNELKAAGAEAIAVNDQRLVVTSSVRNAGPTIYVNNTPQTPPFVIQAIGDPKTLKTVLNLPGGIATQIKAYDPAMFSIGKTELLTLPAYLGGSKPRYARPITRVSTKQEHNQATVNFLEAQLQNELPRLRTAEQALSAYKAHHSSRTIKDQRKLSELTRNYSAHADLCSLLAKKRQDVELQLYLDKLVSGYRGGIEEKYKLQL